MYYMIMNKHTSDTTISFNTPLDVKQRLQKMADDNGVTISVLMRMSAMNMLQNGFRVTPTLEPTPYLRTAIHDAEQELENGTTTTVSSESELDNYLDALKR